jgi:hypothetical protein
MNIFYLHTDPVISAQAMTNKHVVKMILESAQLLSTAHHVLDGDNNLLYKKTHVNHPSNIWTRESVDNYNWLYQHFIALCEEYTKRYGKIHMTQTKLANMLKTPPRNIKHIPSTKVRIAISDTRWHHSDPVQAYRTYYQQEKLKLEQDITRYHSIIGE